MKREGLRGGAPVWYIHGLVEPAFVYDAESVVLLCRKLRTQSPPCEGAKEATGEIGNYFVDGRMTALGLWLVPHPDAM